MQEIINALFNWLLSSDYAQYASIVVFVAYTLAHIIDYLPVKFTAKIPNFVMVALNLLAAKHGTKSAAKKDIKGNPVA